MANEKDSQKLIENVYARMASREGAGMERGAIELAKDARDVFVQVTKAGGFVDQMHRGMLAREVYVQYLKQDWYFLFHFNRAYAMAMVKAKDVEEQRAFFELMVSVGDELREHKARCALLGVSMDEKMNMTSAPVKATENYVRFLESLHSSSLRELLAGMAPCMRLYATLGKWYASEGLEHAGIYRDWFEAYASNEFAALAFRLESLMLNSGDEEQLTATIRANYLRAMELERDFFAAWA